MLHHRAYHSAANDLAFFDQIIWNSAHGRFFATSFVPYNFLGQHVQPILLLYALLYRLWPSPELLLITQAIVAAAAAIPLFHVAQRLMHRDGIAALVAGAYLVSPYLHHAVNFDFHPETMAPFFAFLGYRFILDGRRRAALCALLPLLALKEDTVLLLFGIAWLCWLRRERRLAATLGGIAAGWGILTTLLIMPHFRAGPSDLEERYGYLGNGAAGILTGLATHPERALAHLLTWGTRAHAPRPDRQRRIPPARRPRRTARRRTPAHLPPALDARAAIAPPPSLFGGSLAARLDRGGLRAGTPTPQPPPETGRGDSA